MPSSQPGAAFLITVRNLRSSRATSSGKLEIYASTDIGLVFMVKRALMWRYQTFSFSLRPPSRAELFPDHSSSFLVIQGPPTTKNHNLSSRHPNFFSPPPSLILFKYSRSPPGLYTQLQKTQLR